MENSNTDQVLGHDDYEPSQARSDLDDDDASPADEVESGVGSDLKKASKNSVYFSSAEEEPSLFEYRGYKCSFDPSIGKYSCGLCGSYFRQTSHLYEHIRNVHIIRRGKLEIAVN